MLSRSKKIGFCCLILFLALTTISCSEDMSELKQSYFALPTLGGKQFWADELFFHKWRIQRNVFTGHYRLLDENNRRHAWGTFDQCREILEKIKHQRHLPPMKGKAVIGL